MNSLRHSFLSRLLPLLSSLPLLALSGCFAPGPESPPAAGGADSAGDGRPLVVVSDFTNDLFARWPQGGEPEGFEPKLARAIADELRRPIEWRRLEFSELLEAVASGGADLSIASTGVTPERSLRVDFSCSYFVTRIDAVVRRDDDIRTLDALAGRRVAASGGTTSALALELRLPGAEAVLDRPETVTLGSMLLDGSIDGALMDGPDAERLVATEPRLRRLEEPVAAERYAVAVRLGNTDLLRAVDTVIARLELEGRLEAWARQEGLSAH